MTPEEAEQERAIRAYFYFQIIMMTFVQKIGIPIAICLHVMVASCVWMVIRQRAHLSTSRIILYGLFAVAIFISQLFVGKWFSPTAMPLFLIMYLPALLYFELSRDSYFRILNYFLNVMVIIFAIVVYQVITQRFFGTALWVNLDKLPPKWLISPGFTYWRETSYESGVFQPNGIFFLEPSFVSQFFMLAIVMELVWFRRLWRLALYGIGMILSLAGSGLLILGLMAPILAAKLPPRTLAALGFVLVLGAGVATVTGWTEQASSRAGEIVTPGTSGYMRYTGPVMLAVDRLREDPSSIYTGIGAGTSVYDRRTNVLPMTKALNEYGVIATIVFYVFFLFCIFSNTPSKRIALGFFLYHSLGGGGLTVPIYALMVLLFCAQIRLTEPADPAVDGQEWLADQRSLQRTRRMQEASQTG
jgi:hypothetical protein